MALQADFLGDYAVRCGERLIEAGYTVPAGDPQAVIGGYLNIRHRRVRSRPRAFHMAQYAVPTHLTAGHAMLQQEVEEGRDLWPRQSRSIAKSGVDDGMLNDYGIQHFHLGTTPDTKHTGLSQGTKELVFAFVRDDDFYSIGIFDHDGWSMQSLLDLVHSNWPTLMTPFEVNGIVDVAVSYSDEEVAALRKNGVNVLTKRPDGTIHVGPGGGMASDGTSGATVRDLLRITRFIAEYETTVVSDFTNAIPKSMVNAGGLVTLKWRGGRAYAACGTYELDLLGNLAVPPL